MRSLRARPRHFLSLVLSAALAGCGATQTPRAEPEEASVSIPAATPRLAERARLVHQRFRADHALEVVAFADQFFRVRGNEGYLSTLRYVASELTDGGIDAVTMPALGPVQQTWTPRSATLVALHRGVSTELIGFESESGVDRATLLVGSSSFGPAEVEVVTADEVRRGVDARGKVVLAEGDPRQVYGDLLAGSGAIGLLTRYLEPYHNVEAHPDMAQFGYLPPHEGEFFGFSLSRQDYVAMQGVRRIGVHIQVAVGSSAAVAVDARIEGRDPRAGAIVFVAHVDEPGANDNGSGVGALTELAIALHTLVAERQIPRPRRTLVFLWGQEMEVSRRWLAEPPLPVAAGLVLDMVGEDPSLGAPFLIERMPDPGAIWLRGDDHHTEWGAGHVAADALHGHFLNDLMSAAATQIAVLDGPWSWRTNPYEGGSDHVPFLERELPAVLGWHFTDRAYHTSVDRMDRVSGGEMRRVAATFGAAALTMAFDDDSELAALVEHGRRTRLQDVRAASARLVEEGRSDSATEARVLAAWQRWYAEALASAQSWTDR